MALIHHPENHNIKIAGLDEAGRGCLAGPVAASAVILPPEFDHPLLNDSKQLTKKQRNELRKVIEGEAYDYSVSFVAPARIDEINILWASFEAMHLALQKLQQPPELLLIDGNRFKPYKNIPFECVVKGDGKYLNIAAASILAKTYRDEYMEKYHKEFPQYDWVNNKGYPTQKHRSAIVKYGTCQLHRQSFKLIPEEQMEIFANGK
ncbi:ribonuclease HII [Membranihabitans maritimus]|uniref:ribonuclease HII n=1 Tax=Membranihabitans maritimus TaxID=2904244 RepID=UPI001F02A90F|nr:ribonuclease HII [Membranihabitans maritimus]